MDNHSMIFVTIGNLVSPPGSVNGDPLFDFPDHWQPRFSAIFPSQDAGWHHQLINHVRLINFTCQAESDVIIVIKQI